MNNNNNNIDPSPTFMEVEFHPFIEIINNERYRFFNTLDSLASDIPLTLVLMDETTVPVGLVSKNGSTFSSIGSISGSVSKHSAEIFIQKFRGIAEFCQTLLRSERCGECFKLIYKPKTTRRGDRTSTTTTVLQSSSTLSSSSSSNFNLHQYMMVQFDKYRVDLIKRVHTLSSAMVKTLDKSNGGTFPFRVSRFENRVLCNRLVTLEKMRMQLRQEIQTTSSNYCRVRQPPSTMENIISVHAMAIQADRQVDEFVNKILLKFPSAPSSSMTAAATRRTRENAQLEQYWNLNRQVSRLVMTETTLVLGENRVVSTMEQEAIIRLFMVEVLKGLSRKVWIKDGSRCTSEDDDQVICAVCLGEMKVGDDARAMEYCSHKFHFSCIFEWMVKGKLTCPLCRHETPFGINGFEVKRRRLLS
ncbi:zinc finger protein [Macleaya cordata]|uniref:Zinc finger protein n=1 Tax=Macleaya cordata TaxID=56857 RepID=A0A200PYR2_MACCD|nr:zinc finger protein [Macleaya cordata]